MSSNVLREQMLCLEVGLTSGNLKKVSKAILVRWRYVNFDTFIKIIGDHLRNELMSIHEYM